MREMAEVTGYAPAELLQALCSAQWEPIQDAEGGKVFTGITFAGHQLVKDGGSEDFPVTVVVVDESTGDCFMVKGRTFESVLPQVAQSSENWILNYPLFREPRDGFVRYSLGVIPLILKQSA
ncbi:MAG: hypothetical protein IT406_00795 [Candidatus Yanofskybacteria bacterium]|nr:hypothetical protein [Candidatus Yanofskybacteria bacterium]